MQAYPVDDEPEGTSLEEELERELDEDIFVFKTILDKAFICVLNMRDGKILGKSSTAIDLKNKISDNIYEAIFMSYYSKHILPKQS